MALCVGASVFTWAVSTVGSVKMWKALEVQFDLKQLTDCLQEIPRNRVT